MPAVLRIDSHQGGTWDSPVGKPRGKASWESLEGKPIWRETKIKYNHHHRKVSKYCKLVSNLVQGVMEKKTGAEL